MISKQTPKEKINKMITKSLKRSLTNLEK